MSPAATLWRNARLACCDGLTRAIDDGALVTRGGTIEWVGAERELPPGYTDGSLAVRDLGGHWVTPGLLDCHTHLVFAGTRAPELAARLRGTSYEEIARRGGGIATTVRATRAASEQQLFDATVPRLRALLAEGVTTVEIKSGYGLTLEDEAKMLRVARELGRAFPVTVKTTFLAAHTVPPEFTGRADDYLDVVAARWLPELHGAGLVDAVDVFCDRIAFDAEQAGRLFAAAGELGIPVKMHAEQLANIGGSRTAARFAALSCDHLEHAGPADVRALAAAGVTAVLLPVAFYCLAETQRPPVGDLRAERVPIAVATDCNPGSAPCASLLLAMNMGCRLLGLTAEEALAGATRHAARALGLAGRAGVLAPGAAADFAVWDIAAPEELAYWTGFNPCRAVVRGGEVVAGAGTTGRA